MTIVSVVIEFDKDDDDPSAPSTLAQLRAPQAALSDDDEA